jgi:hypothetical protein
VGRRFYAKRILPSERQLVSHDQAAFHHEPDSFHFGDILERIAGDGDDVGELAFFDRSDLAFPAIVQHPSGR